MGIGQREQDIPLPLMPSGSRLYQHQMRGSVIAKGTFAVSPGIMRGSSAKYQGSGLHEPGPSHIPHDSIIRSFSAGSSRAHAAIAFQVPEIPDRVLASPVIFLVDE